MFGNWIIRVAMELLTFSFPEFLWPVTTSFLVSLRIFLYRTLPWLHSLVWAMAYFSADLKSTSVSQCWSWLLIFTTALTFIPDWVLFILFYLIFLKLDIWFSLYAHGIFLAPKMVISSFLHLGWHGNRNS